MQIPKRGNIYSANEAYSEGWDGSFMRYLKAIKTGRGENRSKVYPKIHRINGW